MAPESGDEHEPAHDDSVTDRFGNERRKLRAMTLALLPPPHDGDRDLLALREG
jgi:hypothetical protein